MSVGLNTTAGDVPVDFHVIAAHWQVQQADLIVIVFDWPSFGHLFACADGMVNRHFSHFTYLCRPISVGAIERWGMTTPRPRMCEQKRQYKGQSPPIRMSPDRCRRGRMPDKPSLLDLRRCFGMYASFGSFA